MRNIFVSTETESVINDLILLSILQIFYYRFNSGPKLQLSQIDLEFDYSHEFVYSFVNLYVAIENFRR